MASHSTDATPASTHSLSSPVHFDECTWEEIVASSNEGTMMEHLQSMEQAEPDAKAIQSDVLLTIFHILRTLPAEEAAVLYDRLNLADFVHYIPDAKRDGLSLPSYLPPSQRNGLNDSNLKAANALYNSGMRRLRRRLGVMRSKLSSFPKKDHPLYNLFPTED